MHPFIVCPRDTDEFQNRTRGYVSANRINDVVAKPDSKRCRAYLDLIRSQFSGEPVIDDNDQYRSKTWEMVPYALAAYERRHEVDTHRHRVYFHSNEAVKIIAVPDGIEEGVCGLTVHFRQDEETYEAAVSKGTTSDLVRHAQAMMLITNQEAWIHLNYWHDMETRQRRLHEMDIRFDKRHASDLEDSMMAFLLRTRRSAA